MERIQKEIKERQYKIVRQLQKNKVDALVISATPQIDHRGILRYYTGYYLKFFEETIVLFADGSSIFFAHDLSGKKTIENLNTVSEVMLIPDYEYNVCPAKCVARLLQKKQVKTVATAGMRSMSALFYRTLKDNLLNCKIIDFSAYIQEQMKIKSSFEIPLIKNAIKKNEDCFWKFKEHVKMGNLLMNAVNQSDIYAREQNAEDINWLLKAGKDKELHTCVAEMEKPQVILPDQYIHVVLEHSFEGGYYGEVAQILSFCPVDRDVTEKYKILKEVFYSIEKTLKDGEPIDEVLSVAENVARKYKEEELRWSQNNIAIGHGQGLASWEIPRIAGGTRSIAMKNMHLAIHPVIPVNQKINATFCKHYLVKENGLEILSALDGDVICLDN